MADYKITVKYGIVALGGAMTAAAIRDSLETLTTTNRLDASAIKNLPNADDLLTIGEIVTALEALTGNDRLSATALKELTKVIVTGAEKALNEIGEGNIYSTTFQAAHPSATILAGDYIIAKDIDTSINGTLIETGDWIIALQDNPGWTFGYPVTWRILKFSKLPDRLLASRRFDDTVSGSGVEPSDQAAYRSFAKGLYSEVTGRYCIATTESSSARNKGAAAGKKGAEAFASERFTYSGDAQLQRQTKILQTTNTTPTEMVLPDNFVITPGKTYDIKVRLVARENLGAKCKSWEWKALVSYTGTPTGNSAISTVSSLTIGTNTLNATLTFSDTLPQKMILTCTGLSSTVRWVAYIESLEVYSEDGLGTPTTEVHEGLSNSYVL